MPRCQSRPLSLSPCFHVPFTPVLSRDEKTKRHNKNSRPYGRVLEPSTPVKPIKSVYTSILYLEDIKTTLAVNWWRSSLTPLVAVCRCCGNIPLSSLCSVSPVIKPYKLMLHDFNIHVIGIMAASFLLFILLNRDNVFLLWDVHSVEGPHSVEIAAPNFFWVVKFFPILPLLFMLRLKLGLHRSSLICIKCVIVHIIGLIYPINNRSRVRHSNCRH